MKAIGFVGYALYVGIEMVVKPVLTWFFTLMELLGVPSC